MATICTFYHNKRKKQIALVKRIARRILVMNRGQVLTSNIPSLPHEKKSDQHAVDPIYQTTTAFKTL